MREEEYISRKKILSKSLEVARREWNKIRTSLELCGDIGEFDPEESQVTDEILISEDPFHYKPPYIYFMKNLIKMDETPLDLRSGYKTIEAMYNFATLVTKASARLGLVGKFAVAFGDGYGFVRTGWPGTRGAEIEQKIFYQMFFSSKEDSTWDFDSQKVKEKLKKIFDRFMEWQNNPHLYNKEKEGYIEPKGLD